MKLLVGFALGFAAAYWLTEPTNGFGDGMGPGR